jgi:hypothetical protein
MRDALTPPRVHFVPSAGISWRVEHQPTRVNGTLLAIFSTVTKHPVSCLMTLIASLTRSTFHGGRVRACSIIGMTFTNKDARRYDHE